MVMTDLEKINSPNEWPLWPRLPMVRLSDRKAGFIVEAGTTVYFSNVWEEMAEQVEKAEYESIDALLAEWRVD